MVIEYFSTKEAAEEYILMNKPCLSYNDVINKWWSIAGSKPDSLKLLKTLIKSKL